MQKNIAILFFLSFLSFGCFEKQQSSINTFSQSYNFSGTWIKSDSYSLTFLSLIQNESNVFGEGVFFGCTGESYFDVVGNFEKGKLQLAFQDKLGLLFDRPYVFSVILENKKVKRLESEKEIFVKETPHSNQNESKTETIFSKKKIPVLLEELNSKKPNIRKMAILSLGELGVEARKYVEQIIPFLKDENEEVRLEASLALGKFGLSSIKALPMLIELIENEYEKETIRQSALISALKIYPKSIEFGESYFQNIQIYGHVCNIIPPFLLRLLKDKNQVMQLYAIKALSRYAGSDVIAILDELNNDEKAEVREEARIMKLRIENF